MMLNLFCGSFHIFSRDISRECYDVHKCTSMSTHAQHIPLAMCAHSDPQINLCPDTTCIIQSILQKHLHLFAQKTTPRYSYTWIHVPTTNFKNNTTMPFRKCHARTQRRISTSTSLSCLPPSPHHQPPNKRHTLTPKKRSNFWYKQPK
jgi:hypothetical protein